MDISSIVTVVGSVGFPIVACCGMAWFIATTFSDFNDLMTKNNVLTEELIALLKDNKGDSDVSNMASRVSLCLCIAIDCGAIC